MENGELKQIMIYFRGGGLIISETRENIAFIARRMGAGGHMVCEDALWGRQRQVAVNLSDVVAVDIRPVVSQIL